MRSLFTRLEIARDMAVHAPLVPDWTIEIHERTLAAVRGSDFAVIDEVMDEHLSQLEQILKIGEHVGDLEALRDRARLGPIVVAKRDELGAFDFREHREVRELRYRSSADEPEPDRVPAGL